jgi:hypothetical protein
MITSNPFAELAVFLPPLFMPAYIVLMVVAVAVGTLADMRHKGSDTYFRRQWKQSMAAATRRIGVDTRISLAFRTLFREVLTSGEFCNVQRRLSHLLLFYGFLTYLVSTVILVFVYPTPAAPAPPLVPLLWNAGAVMVLIGGLWFFFLLRVDVAKDGRSPFRLARADLFIASLLASVASALVWEYVQTLGNLRATQIAFAVYLAFSSLLFLSVFWSKFTHMFYKPVAAYQKRVEEAGGASTLPRPAGANYLER